MLIISGPIAEAVKLIITADKTQVRAGDASENMITFTTWINISNPDAFIPMQRVFLNLSGNSTRSFSFDLDGSNKQGEAFSNEISVTAENDSFGSSNFGTGVGYDFNTGTNVSFGSGYGYGNGTSLNRTFIVTLNTSRIFDGNYTATPSLYAAGSTTYSFTTSPITFTVLPRVITTSVPSIIGINETPSGVISTPVGDFEYIVATNSTAPPVTINVTVSVAPPSGATNISSTFAGAISDVYFNVSVNDSAWFNNVSYVQFRAFYNASKVPANVAESTLRASRFTSSSWVRLDCAELGGCNATLADGTILYAAGVDTTSKFVYANLSHFSTFAIAGTVAAAAAAGGGVSGGTGGGGVTTTEPFDNIAKAERYDKSLIANTPVTYTFKEPELGIYEIAVTGKENENDIALRVEALKSTSKLVTIQPPGTVYKNLNVWAGTKRIKEALIRFKIENTWLGSNSLAGSDVKMVKWDGSQWVQIDTSVKTSDTTYTYYEAKTDTFSIFAITGLKGVAVPTATPAVEVTETPVKPAGTGTPSPIPTKAPGFEAIIAILAISLLGASLLRDRKRG